MPETLMMAEGLMTRTCEWLVGWVSNLDFEILTRACVRHCAPDPAVDRWRSGASPQKNRSNIVYEILCTGTSLLR